MAVKNTGAERQRRWRPALLSLVTAQPRRSRAHQGLDALRDEIARHRAAQPAPTWGLLASFFGVNKATLWRISNEGYEPKAPAIRRRLGLPVTLEPAFDVCECGNRYVKNVPWRKGCYECRPPRK